LYKERFLIKVKMFKSKYFAFTLLELLFVIALLSILSGVTYLIINPKKQLAKSRDAQRLADIATLVTAIQEYNSEHGTFPDDAEVTRVSNQLAVGDNLYLSTGSWINVNLSEFLPKIVIDPLNTGQYVYRYQHNNIGYEVDTTFENYSTKQIEDGGNNANKFELGTDLTILD